MFGSQCCFRLANVSPCHRYNSLDGSRSPTPSSSTSRVSSNQNGLSLPISLCCVYFYLDCHSVIISSFKFSLSLSRTILQIFILLFSVNLTVNLEFIWHFPESTNTNSSFFMRQHTHTHTHTCTKHSGLFRISNTQTLITLDSPMVIHNRKKVLVVFIAFYDGVLRPFPSHHSLMFYLFDFDFTLHPNMAHTCTICKCPFAYIGSLGVKGGVWRDPAVHIRFKQTPPTYAIHPKPREPSCQLKFFIVECGILFFLKP